MLARVFEHAPVGIAVTGDDLQFRLVNPRLAGMLGYEPGEMLGWSWQRLTHPDDATASAAIVSHILNGDQSLARIEKRYLHRDGSAVWASVTVQAVEHPAGGERLIVALVQDLTQRRESDALARSLGEELGRKSELLSRLVEQSPLAVFLTDGEGKIYFANSASAALVGADSADGLVGRRLQDLDSGGEQPDRGVFEEAHAAGRWSGERLLRLLNGSQTVPVHLTCFRLEDAAAASSVALVAENIEQRKRMEKQLRAREEKVRRLNPQAVLGSRERAPAYCA